MEELKRVIRGLNEFQFILEGETNKEEDYHRASKLANMGCKLIALNDELKEYYNSITE